MVFLKLLVSALSLNFVLVVFELWRVALAGSVPHLIWAVAFSMCLGLFLRVFTMKNT